MRLSQSPDFPYWDYIIKNSKILPINEYFAAVNKLDPLNVTKPFRYAHQGLYQTRDCKLRPMRLRLETTPGNFRSWPGNTASSFVLSRRREGIKFAFDAIMLEMIRFGLVQALENRRMFYWERDFGRKYWRKACQVQFQGGVRVIDYAGANMRFDEIVSALFVLGLGVVASVGVCVLEHLRFRRISCRIRLTNSKRTSKNVVPEDFWIQMGFKPKAKT